jgi:hypothetical protein
MSELAGILSAAEGLAPEVVAEIEKYVKNKEAELVSTLEEKYGTKPAVMSDAPAAPADPVGVAASSAPQDVIPAVPAVPATDDATVQALLSRLASMEAQLTQLKAQQNDPQSIVPGSGEPVPHNLFLDDGTVIKNHGGLATEYTSVEPATATTDAKQVVRKVVAAYPA